ncbi:HIT domain-containing protein [Amycolatopsis sp. DSM 110486]|nr:HIT domain-containing protein [Amycolatopsis sp. DSM 110486]
MTREQRGLGHLLVIPIEHRQTLLDIRSDEASAIMASVITAARAITGAYQAEGIAIWQNNGVPAHQAIPHVHFHIAGTLPDGGTEWDDVEEASLAETEVIAEKLRHFMQ